MTLVPLFKKDRHGLKRLPGSEKSSAALSAPGIHGVGQRPVGGFGLGEGMRRPSSTLLPSGQTTSGLLASAPSICSALDDPGGHRAREVIPPSTLTKTLLTWLARITSSPAAITSRRGAATDVEGKLAGFTSPCFTGVGDDVEGCDMTRPALLLITPDLAPSSSST